MSSYLSSRLWFRCFCTQQSPEVAVYESNKLCTHSIKFCIVQYFAIDWNDSFIKHDMWFSIYLIEITNPQIFWCWLTIVYSFVVNIVRFYIRKIFNWCLFFLIFILLLQTLWTIILFDFNSSRDLIYLKLINWRLLTYIYYTHTYIYQSSIRCNKNIYE